MGEINIQPPKRMGIYGHTGLVAPKQGGLYVTPYEIQKRHPSAWVRARPHNFPIRDDVLAMLELEPEIIIHFGHSLGVGEGLVNFQEILRKCGRVIDLAICIDPVPLGWGNYGRSLAETSEPMVISPDIREVISVRTFNRPKIMGFLSFAPWGRTIVHPNVIQWINFRSGPVGHSRFNEIDIIDPKIQHHNIDESPIVQDMILRQVERLAA